MSLRDAASKFIQTVICQISLAESKELLDRYILQYVDIIFVEDQRNDLVKIIIGQMITPAVRIGLKAMAEVRIYASNISMNLDVLSIAVVVCFLLVCLQVICVMLVIIFCFC